MASLTDMVASGVTPYATESLSLVDAEDQLSSPSHGADVPVAKVLILYAGGTIGMAHTSKGFAPVRGADATQPPCTTPVTDKGKRIAYTIKEYDPLLDSCNMSHEDWARLAKDVFDNYDDYDAFVVLHGTDTMAFTASALSFMLHNLGKTVVVTGSQIPLSLQRNDGVGNLLGALIIAGHYIIPEVTLFFHNKLMRGNRTTKVDSAELDAFNCPNSAPLASLGVDIRVSWDLVLPQPLDPLELNTAFEPNVAVMSLYPGVRPELLASMMKPPMKGVVLRTFGAGNGPDQSPEFLGAIRAATDSGLVIINVTQCTAGGVAAHYATGQALSDAGVVPGMDLTVEAALAKLGHVLAQGYSPSRIRDIIMTSMRGELTPPAVDWTVDMGSKSFFRSVYRAMSQGSTDPYAAVHIKRIQDALAPVLLCTAAGRGDLDQLRAMHSDGADVNAADYDGRTPLHLAASEGHVDCVRWLIGAGAVLSPIDRWHGTPYTDAIRHRHEDVVVALEAAGASSDVATRVGKVCDAAAAGNLEQLAAVVEAAPDLNLVTADGHTALTIAAANGHAEAVEMLLKAGARGNLPNRAGVTPLQAAVDGKHGSVAKVLQAAGVASGEAVPVARRAGAVTGGKREVGPKGAAARAAGKLATNVSMAASYLQSPLLSSRSPTLAPMRTPFGSPPTLVPVPEPKPHTGMKKSASSGMLAALKSSPKGSPHTKPKRRGDARPLLPSMVPDVRMQLSPPSRLPSKHYRRRK